MYEDYVPDVEQSRSTASVVLVLELWGSCLKWVGRTPPPPPPDPPRAPAIRGLTTKAPYTAEDRTAMSNLIPQWGSWDRPFLPKKNCRKEWKWYILYRLCILKRLDELLEKHRTVLMCRTTKKRIALCKFTRACLSRMRVSGSPSTWLRACYLTFSKAIGMMWDLVIVQ